MLATYDTVVCPRVGPGITTTNPSDWVSAGLEYASRDSEEARDKSAIDHMRLLLSQIYISNIHSHFTILGGVNKAHLST